MKVLLLQHFESYWEESLKNMNTSFEECMSKVVDFVVSRDDIDKIIITLFEDAELNHEYGLLEKICDDKGITLEAHNYAYAWYKDPNPEDSAYPESTRNIDWCPGTRDHHGEEDVIQIDPWQKELKEQNAYVFLGGAFDGECVKDQEAALDMLEINYERVEGLIVGSGYGYEFVLKSYEEVDAEMAHLMEEVAERYNDLMDECDDDEDLLLDECLDELVAIEKELNNFVSTNRTVIEMYDIEYHSDVEAINEIVHANVRNNRESTPYSDIAEARTLNTIKEKLKSNDKVVEDTPKTKSKNKLTA